MQNFRAASVQFQHAPGDKAANLRIIERFVEQAARQNVQVLVFPECCISGYWHLRHFTREALLELAEPAGTGPSSLRIRELARTHGMTIGAGFIERTGEGTLYNAYIVALPDGAWHVHRKIHAFISVHVSSGSVITLFDIPACGRAAVLTCYDNNINENVRLAALQGAEFLLAPHQTGGCSSINRHTMGLVDRALWENRHSDPAAIEAELRGPKGRAWLMRWLPSRAHDNGLFLIFSNGIGPDDDEIRTGNAMILDPYGRILTETCKAGDDMIMADLDASLLEECTGRRWIRTRRPELYTPLTVPTGREVDTRTARFDTKGV